MCPSVTNINATPTETAAVRMDLYERSPGTLLNEREVAAALFISVKTLQLWRQQGRGPRFLRLVSHVRYRAGDVVEWMEQNRG